MHYIVLLAELCGGSDSDEFEKTMQIDWLYSIHSV